MQEVVKAVPLASTALFSPYPYDAHYEVPIQLDEPLWTPRSGPKVVAMDILGLCTQLDTILGTSGGSSDVSKLANRRVSFEKNLGSRASGVIQQIKERLRKARMDDDVESYMRVSAIGYIFPRVELFLQEPEQELAMINSPIMDGYFGYLSSLNCVLALANQINSDIISSPSHKYIAHQTALLYQCVSHVSQLSKFKQEIEGKFTAIKVACSQQPSGHPPRLTHDLQTWLVGVTQDLAHMTSRLSEQSLASNNRQVAEVLSTLRDIDY